MAPSRERGNPFDSAGHAAMGPGSGRGCGAFGGRPARAVHATRGRGHGWAAVPYGWGISTTARGTKRIAHNGGNGIFAADFQRFVDEESMFFIASNRSEFPCIPFSPAIETLLFGGTVELPPPVVKLDRSALGPLAGVFALAGGAA